MSSPRRLKYRNCPQILHRQIKKLSQLVHILGKINGSLSSARHWNYSIKRRERSDRSFDICTHDIGLIMEGGVYWIMQWEKDLHGYDTRASLHNATSFLSGTRYFCHEAISREHFRWNRGKWTARLAAFD